MRLLASNALQVIVALLTAYLFFTLSQCPEQERSARSVYADPATMTPPATVSPDSLHDERTQAPAGAPPVLSRVDPIVIEHGPRDERVVALTFDACSTREPSKYDERITEVLIQTQTPATLFLGGKWMAEEAEQTKRLAANPLFELGNHTYLHPHMREVSDERIREELQSTQNIMDSLTGKSATLFRPPYGEYDDRVVRIAASLGLKTVQFDLASGDPDPAIGKEKLISYVSSMVRNGSIVVLHINQRGWHTAEALPGIISRLRQRGFVFKTVSKMIHDATPAQGQTNQVGN